VTAIKITRGARSSRRIFDSLEEAKHSLNVLAATDPKTLSYEDLVSVVLALNGFGASPRRAARVNVRIFAPAKSADGKCTNWSARHKPQQLATSSSAGSEHMTITRSTQADKGKDMQQRFEAIVLFTSPEQAVKGSAALAAVDCKFVHDPTMVDEYSAAVFGMVTGMTEFGEDELWSWLWDLITPFGGDVCELGLASEMEKRMRRQRCGDCGEKLADPSSELCPGCGALIAQL
jgi:Fe-S-cluster formation regulator IscX/YfhJ